jgi:uncharacterized membrane protein
MLSRAIFPALSVLVSVSCERSDRSQETRPNSPVTAFRAVGTEPFWSLDIDNAGRRFTTPEDMGGIHSPPFPSLVAGDTVRWVGETERAAVDARIWCGQRSDGMSPPVSDRAAWPLPSLDPRDGAPYHIFILVVGPTKARA